MPPIYMDDLRKCQASGKLSLIEGEPQILRSTEEGKVLISMGQKHVAFDCIIIACGIKPNCIEHPLVQKYRSSGLQKSLVDSLV